MSLRAKDSFRFHHGGGEREAEIQLRNMLEDFLLRSARSHSDSGFISLARDGFVLVLSPSSDTITGYSTVHRERTWEQVKAGVKSRFRRGGRARKASGPTPDAGPPVLLAEFHRAFNASGIHLTARLRSSYAKLTGQHWASDEELDASIRAAVVDLASGNIAERESGMFDVDLDGRTWLVSPDCRSLVGVKKLPVTAETC